MTAPPPAHRDQLAVAAEALGLQVDRETVLQVRAVLLGEALGLKDEIRFRTPDMEVGECGGDPVSFDAALAFSERIAALVDECRRYTEKLEAAGSALGEIAHRYGFSDSESAQSFSS